MDRAEAEEPFADEPRRVGGSPPEEDDEAARGGEDGAKPGERPEPVSPTEEIENPSEGEAPSG
jgi:hypothetical protein